MLDGSIRSRTAARGWVSISATGVSPRSRWIRSVIDARPFVHQTETVFMKKLILTLLVIPTFCGGTAVADFEVVEA